MGPDWNRLKKVPQGADTSCEMIFRTRNSVYEVRPDERRFRRLRRGGDGRIAPASEWQPYEHVGTVAVGHRVRFFLRAEDAGAAETWTTTPVCELLAAV